MPLAILLDELVQGPLELPIFGRSVTVYPTQETTRAGRYPSQAVVVTAAARRIIELSKGGEKVQSIVVHGEVDPTRHPEFPAISANLRELCNKWYPKARLCLLSDRARLENAQASHALNFYDVPSLRLEAGTQKTHAALSGGAPGGLKALVDELSRLEHRNLVIRATFVRGRVDNSTENEVRAWIRYLKNIKPAVVEISTPAKAKSKERRPITKTRMGQIQAQVAERVGCAVEVVAG